MRFVEGLLKFIVVVAPLVVLLTLSTKYVVKQANLVLDNVHTIAEDQIGVALGRDVSIRSIKIFPIGHAEASGITLPDFPGPGVSPGQNLVTVDNLIVEYDFNALLEGKGAQSVKRITANNPIFNLVRRSTLR